MHWSRASSGCVGNGISLEKVAKACECPELRGPHGVGIAVQASSDFFVRQPFEEPEKHHLLLFGRQPAYCVLDAGCFEFCEELSCWVSGFVFCFWERIDVRYFSARAEQAHGGVVRDRQQPWESARIVAKTIPAAPGTQKDIGGHVFGPVPVTDEDTGVSVDAIDASFVELAEPARAPDASSARWMPLPRCRWCKRRQACHSCPPPLHACDSTRCLWCMGKTCCSPFCYGLSTKNLP